MLANPSHHDHDRRNAVLRKHLGPVDRFGLRLTNIACAAGAVLLDDLRIHPWKLALMVTPFPLDLSIVIAGTLLYFALGITKRGREGRAKIVRSAVAPIDYGGFKHFYKTKIRKSRVKAFNKAAAAQGPVAAPTAVHAFLPGQVPAAIDEQPKKAAKHTHKQLGVEWARVRKTMYWNGKINALTTLHDWLSRLPPGRLASHFNKKAERMMTTARAKYPADIARRRAYCQNPVL